MKTLGKIILGYLGFIVAFIVMTIVIGLCAAFAEWDMKAFNVIIDAFTSVVAIRFIGIFMTIIYGLLVITFLKSNK